MDKTDQIDKLNELCNERNITPFVAGQIFGYSRAKIDYALRLSKSNEVIDKLINLIPLIPIIPKNALKIAIYKQHKDYDCIKSFCEEHDVSTTYFSKVNGLKCKFSLKSFRLFEAAGVFKMPEKKKAPKTPLKS